MLLPLSSIAYVALCAIGIVGAIVMLVSVTETSYLLMQSKAVKFLERNYFKKCARALAVSLACCALCVFLMDLMRPTATPEVTLLMAIVIVFEFGFFLGICPPFLNEEKRLVRKKHLLS